MSTKMVGEDTELDATSDPTDGVNKETKKARPINAFFQPVRAEEGAKTLFGKEIPPANSKKTSQSLTSSVGVNKRENEIFQDTKTPALTCNKVGGSGETVKKKQCPLDGNLGYQALKQESSLEEEFKSKQIKSKWSVTCAVQGTSKLLNSSGSDFEDDGKDLFSAKNKLVQKSCKKRARDKSRTAHKCKGKTSESSDDKEKDLETSQVEQIEDESQGITDIEAKASINSAQSKQFRTSAFDVLMNSQRVKKQEDDTTEISLEESRNVVEIISEKSNSCDIVDYKEMLHSKSNVKKVLESGKDSSPDRIHSNKNSETNAFDLLMKKGKSPSKRDSQPQSELDEPPKTFDGLSKKKLKKKSFEFHLSICGGKKKNVEFFIESDNPSSDVVDCKKNVKGKRKRCKPEGDGSELVESKSDEAFLNDNSEEVTVVFKSKRGRQTSKVVNEKNVEGDQVVMYEKIKNEKKGRKTGKRSSCTNAIGSELNDALCIKEAQCRSRNKQQRGNDDVDAKEMKEKRNVRARRRGDTASSPAQFQDELPCTEDLEMSKRRRDQKKKSEQSSKEQSGIDIRSMDEGKNRADIEKEKATKDLSNNEITALCKEPKPLASIFLKKKPFIPKTDIPEEPPSVVAHSVTSPTTTLTACSVIMVDKTTNQCNITDVDSSSVKEKPTIDQEAAKKAFNALFTGAHHQKTLPSVTAAEVLPAPWPAVSHVVQKEHCNSLGVDFWSLPWPIGGSHKSDDRSCHLLPEVYISNTISQQSTFMFCGRRIIEQSLCHFKKLEPEDKATEKKFSEVITKSIVSELALFYPGIPLRRLYKRYFSKLQKYRASGAVVDLEQTVPEKKPEDRVKSNEESLGDKDGKDNIVANSLCTKRGKRKQQLSCDEKRSQEKEITRKHDSKLVKQGTRTDQLVKKPRQKRRREDDGDQYQVEVIKERRLSLRIRRKKTNLESDTLEDNLEQPETASSMKKRRKTSNHQDGLKETSEPSMQFKKTAEIPVVPNSDTSNLETFVNDTLWTELYRPLHSTEVMANASSVSKLRSWLQEWKIKREKTLRKELQQQKRLLAKQKDKQAQSRQGSTHSLEWWDADSDSDFQMSDHASDESDTAEGGLNTAMFISGPTGVGKTAMVYACAEELGYKVFEVNSSSRRSGKQIMSQLEEATQSHLVIRNKGVAPPSSFSGIFDKPVNNSPPTTGPLSAFLQKNINVSETKASKSGKRKKDRNMKEKKKQGSKGKSKSILKQPSQPVKDDSESCSNLSSKAASLILFEEVDVIFEEDKSFWMAVNSFLQNAKCPIVLISTDSQVSCEGRYDQIMLKPPSVNLLAAHLQLVALTNNIFVNPEDLKSLVAQNNCDIRKSLFDLQFWSASGGGVKVPYKRPVNLESSKIDVGNNDLKPQHTSATCESSTENLKTGTSSQDVHQFEPLVTGGILNDDGEESLFLSVSDWQVIKSQGAAGSLRSSRRGIPGQANGDNSDSDFYEPKRAKLFCPDGSADSVFEITDTNDSQPVSTADEKADTLRQLPSVDSLLFESVHGFLNCVADPTVGALSILQKGKKSGDKLEEYGISDKLHLTHFSQRLDVNLIETNLSNLIPLFAESASPLPQTGQDPQGIPFENQTTDVNPPIAEETTFTSIDILSDRSLFDDGTDESTNRGETEGVMERDQTIDKESEDGRTKTLSNSQDSADTGFSGSQPKEGTDAAGEGEMHEEDSASCGETVMKGGKHARKTPSNRERCCTKALDVFAQFAENQSFSDAFCPSLSVSNTQSSSVDFGWWKTALKPGLTDEHVTVEEYSHWLARDTRASIRGALEVANLESCRAKVNCLKNDLEEIKTVVEEESTSMSENELYSSSLLSEDLPPRDCSSLLHLNSPSLIQKSSTASRRKLYTSLASCIPSLYHCDHRCLASDYIPTFRLLCYSERLREAANIKRRFLHYLDLNSFPLSRSTMEALADSYLGQ